MNAPLLTASHHRNLLNPEFTVVRHGDRLSVPGYSYGYFAFGTVASYAIENDECPMDAVRREKKNRHYQLAFVYPLASIIDTSGRSGNEKALDGAPAGAKLRTLALGSLVWLEGHCYRLDADHNRNIKLTPGTVRRGGAFTVKKGVR